MPLAGGFLDGPEAAASEQLYPLPVHVCGDCALVQIVKPIDPAILFQDYSFSASTIPGLVAHFDNYAKWLGERFHPRTVVEFGCNDGVLLRPLTRLGIVSVGVDLSNNIGETARAEGHDVVTAGFTPQIARQIRDRVGPADVVTGSNSFAHNAEPETLLAAADIALGHDGRLCLEVMYAADLFEQLQWDTLYHEHLTFYGLTQLERLLGRNGFVVEHAQRMPMHGGSLRVVAARPDCAVRDSTVDELEGYEERLGITEAAVWHEFSRRARRTIDVVSSVLGGLREGHRIWGYGAAGKATMWVNACGLDFLEAVVDASPLRAGKFMPGTHTPIVLPELFRQAEPPSMVLVTAWNYLEAISRSESWYEGLWVTPLPSLSFS
jgi:novobiocin biosynthesis protein NovU/D-mycarose 3-C-methyltransferase